MNSIKLSKLSQTFFGFSIIIIVLHFLLHPLRVFNMQTSIFYMDEEFTLASFLTVGLAFYCGILALQTYFKGKNIGNILWSGIFWGLAFDEYFSVHEYLNDLLKFKFEVADTIKSLASVSWVLTLGVVILLVVAFILIQTLKEKNDLSRKLLVFGLISYLLVLVLELSGGQTYGKSIYLLFIGFEEGLEMLGTVFFIEYFYIKLQNYGKAKDSRK